MPHKRSILISIRQKYVASIINGVKTAEIRRIFPANPNVNKVYVYVPTPKQHIVGYFDISEVVRLPVAELWSFAGRQSALSRDEFFDYLSGKDVGVSIHFGKFSTLTQQVSLAEIRAHFQNFHPPQSFIYVSVDMEKLFGVTDSDV
ncbi:MAG: ASCH domain-containing protein [Humidesulfovibrio sp.]|nr:ASCH domain-containing protein [Humidesulfovibrio sp.]